MASIDQKNPWPERNPLLRLLKVTHESSWANQRSICQGMVCGHQIWNHWPKCSVGGTKGHKRIILGQTEVIYRMIIKQIGK